MNNLYEAIKNRRSIRGISKEKVVSDDEIKAVIEQAILHTPSAFDSRTTRVALLLNNNHDKLWDITKEELRKVVPADKFVATEERINAFKNGYATVLFFEDNVTIKNFQEKFAAYKNNFPVWSQQTSGMHQYVIWTLLEEKGFGASLQHYNELIETTVKKEWNIDDNWTLIAQMPFGKPTEKPADKDPVDISKQFKTFE